MTMAKHGHLVAADLRRAAPVAFRIDDSTAFAWRATDQGMQVVDGDTEATTVVELSERTFSEFIDELLTATGAVRTGRARITSGTLAGWQRWEPAIQSLCSGRENCNAAACSTSRRASCFHEGEPNVRPGVRARA